MQIQVVWVHSFFEQSEVRLIGNLISVESMECFPTQKPTYPTSSNTTSESRYSIIQDLAGVRNCTFTGRMSGRIYMEGEPKHQITLCAALKKEHAKHPQSHCISRMIFKLLNNYLFRTLPDQSPPKSHPLASSVSFGPKPHGLTTGHTRTSRSR